MLQGFVALRGDELLHFGTAVDTWGTGLAEDAHDLAVDRLARRGVGTARLWAFRENERARPAVRAARVAAYRGDPAHDLSPEPDPRRVHPRPRAGISRDVQTAPVQSRDSSASMKTCLMSCGFWAT